MTKARLTFLPFVIYILLLALPGNLMVPSVTAAFKYLHEGMKMPNVTGVDLVTGNEISSDQFVKDDNVLIVVFWASWSARSIEQLQAMKEISNEFKNQPIKVIAVNVDSENISQTKREKLTKIVTDLDLPFPTIVDDKLELFYAFGVIAVPSTAITDNTGIIKYGPAGYSLSTRDGIVDSIMVLLGLKDFSDTTKIRAGYVPDNKALRYYNLALTMRHKGLYKRALSNLETSQQADSGFPAPYGLKGELFLLTNDAKSAIEQYQKAISLDSEFVAAQAGLGRAFLADGQLEPATIQLEKLVAFDDTYTPAITDLSLCYLKQDRIEEAKTLLMNALELNPRDANVLFYLGQLQRANKNNAEAIQTYISALEILFPHK